MEKKETATILPNKNFDPYGTDLEITISSHRSILQSIEQFEILLSLLHSQFFPSPKID